MHFFTGGRVIMDYGLYGIWVLNVFMMDLFQLLSSQMLTDGLECCDYCVFYQTLILTAPIHLHCWDTDAVTHFYKPDEDTNSSSGRPSAVCLSELSLEVSLPGFRRLCAGRRSSEYSVLFWWAALWRIKEFSRCWTLCWSICPTPLKSRTTPSSTSSECERCVCFFCFSCSFTQK